MTSQQYYYGTGRRKTSIARVRVYNTPGGSTVNGKPIDEVFTVGAWLRQAISPLGSTGLADKVTVVAKTHGGGGGGQAGAFAHGLARALVNMDENLRKPLRDAGLMTRDPRMKESKKYGLKRARKAPQYTKR
ncbi:MAG: 30S ribosomal protein S9 [Chloroflexi bacterium]|nr:30S ribosomal protein S9 [Chloroflexota bacterium]MBO03771.1 30S ribosomal protein S9 [Chloroflexota bacterium]